MRSATGPCKKEHVSVKDEREIADLQTDFEFELFDV